MSRKNSNGGLLAATLVALALTACGSIQGASPARAGVPAPDPAAYPAGENKLDPGVQARDADAGGLRSIGSDGGGTYLSH